MTALSMLGIDVADGTVLWREAYSKLEGQCFTPVWHRDVLYAPTGVDGAAEGFRLSADGAEVTKLWTQKRMSTHHGGVVAIDGYVYGTHGHSRLACLDVRNGRFMFESVQRTGLGAILGADGMLYVLFQDGTLSLVAASPTDYEPISSFKITKGTGEFWSHPALSDGRLYVRHGDALMVYGVKAGH